MQELNRYDFTNSKSFITYLLSSADTRRMRVPEVDVIGLRRRVVDPVDDEREGPLLVMRPDEALILARLLIDAVWQVTEGYTVGEPKAEELRFQTQFDSNGIRVTQSGVPLTDYRLLEDENGERRIIQLSHR